MHQRRAGRVRVWPRRRGCCSCMRILTTRASTTAPPSRTTSPSGRRSGSSLARSARKARSSASGGPSSRSITRTNSAATESASSPRRCARWASANPIYLGGAGRWRDSGMEGTAPRGRRRFVDADEREAVGALVAIIREQRPHVVVTYDPKGGYGHPDHVHAYTVTTAAVAAAGSGGPATIRASHGRCRSSTGRSWRKAHSRPPTTRWRVTICGPSGRCRRRWTTSRSDIPTRTSTPSSRRGPDAHAAKVAALAAHATQVVVGPTGRVCALSNNMAMPILGHEHYVLAVGSPGERDERGWETDLLAGLGFDGAATR